MATRSDRSPGRIYIPRWVQLAVLPALLIVGWFVLGAVGQVVFVFLVAGLVALVLNPLVHGLERVKVPRFVAVFLVYFAFVAVVVVIASLVWPPVVHQIRSLTAALPGKRPSARGRHGSPALPAAESRRRRRQSASISRGFGITNRPTL